MKKNWKRTLSLLLAVCMLAGLLVVPAAAEYATKEAALDALTTAIADAEAAIEAVTVSEEDGADVDPNEKWVTQGAMDAYTNAIATAKAVAADAADEEAEEEVTQEQVEAALTALETAAGTFVTAQQPGTKGSDPDPEPEESAEPDPEESAEPDPEESTEPDPEESTEPDPEESAPASAPASQAAQESAPASAPASQAAQESAPASQAAQESAPASAPASQAAQESAPASAPASQAAQESAPASAPASQAAQESAPASAPASQAAQESAPASQAAQESAPASEAAQESAPASNPPAASADPAESAPASEAAQESAAVSNPPAASADPAESAPASAPASTQPGESPVPSAEPSEKPLPSGPRFDVVPGNLGQIDEASELPANGLATGYAVTGVLTDKGQVYVRIQADSLTIHANANGTESYWIGFGMPIESGKSYTYCLVESNVAGEPIGSIPGRVQTVADKDYNTVYFGLDAEDAGKTVTYIIRQTGTGEGEGDIPVVIDYTIEIMVAKLTDPLTEAINAAKEARKDVEVSTKNGSDVVKSKKWVTQEDWDALAVAIAAAEAAEGKTLAEKAQAIAALNKAVEDFEAAQKPGTKANRSSSGGSVSTPSEDPSGKTSETLADGTKRDTVTDKDGKVTVTETRPDGTKTVTTAASNGGLITNVTLGPGVRNAKFSVPVGDANSSMVAVVVNADGTEEIIRDTAVVDGNVIFKLDKDATVRIVNNAKSFVDIRGHWGQAYVNFVSARELFNGVDAAHFAPDAAMTRGMMATVLFRLDGETKSNSNVRFGDVKPGEWYSDAVDWAAKQGIVNGYTDGTFLPTKSINREELAVMIYRYAKAAGLVTQGADTLIYADADQVSDWAKEAVSWLTLNGILNGRLDNRFDPKGNATRAEVSAVLERYVTLVSK